MLLLNIWQTLMEQSHLFRFSPVIDSFDGIWDMRITSSPTSSVKAEDCVKRD